MPTTLFERVRMWLWRFTASGQGRVDKPNAEVVIPAGAMGPVELATDPLIKSELIADVEEPLHAPLLAHLAGYRREQLTAGLVVFHGCSTGSAYIEVDDGRLSGTRKWVSQDAEYASYYAGSYGQHAGNATAGLLWVARVCADIPALKGSQYELLVHSPWGDKFPSMFPNAYARYAKAILNVTGPTALINASNNECKEILITSPGEALEVLEVIQLPEDPEEAREVGRKVAERYASLISPPA